MRSRSGLWRALRVALLLAALAHATGPYPLRLVTGLDLAIDDARLRALMPRTADPRIAIVDIDEQSLAEIGRWPWSRGRLAALTDAMFVQQQAAVVGFDMLFAEPDTSSGDAWRSVEVDRVRVKGKHRSVTLFTPAVAPDSAAPTFDEEMRLWQLALGAYRRQQWSESQARLQGLRTAYAESPYAGLYRQLDQRIAHHRGTPPPADWDGAHTFDSK